MEAAATGALGGTSSGFALRSRLPCLWPSAGRDLLFLGIYLTLKGYHSFDGDQAYRLPLLLHWLDPSLYASDPFVRAFDAFNPHRGWLGLLWGLSKTVGLSAGLVLLFAATFVLTCRGIDRLARATWPRWASPAGSVAIGMLFFAKAGNIGTNHLFEAMVLDRVTAMALGWNAIADVLAAPNRGALRPSVLLGLAAVIHPSLGLQLGLIIAGTWLLAALFHRHAEVPPSLAFRGAVLAGVCIAPGLLVNLRSGHLLMQGLSPGEFWTLAVELQSPQHMLPHLWRMPQWLAWGCYPLLAALVLFPRADRQVSERRLLMMLGLVLAWLAAAWVGIELLRHPRVTVFQPFRIATLARGLCLILIAGRVVSLWNAGTWMSRTRSLLIVLGLAGDWLMVVVTAVELIATAGEKLAPSLSATGFFIALASGLYFLSRHDTEYGHRTMLLILTGWLVMWIARDRLTRVAVRRRPRGHGQVITPRLQSPGLIALAWSVPALALLAGTLPDRSALAETRLVRGLVARCRFAPVATDDVERLALWCRENTPATAHFVGPPGPKTFRLWSQRSLVFNRAGSPYHAAGLADWFARFQDVVGTHEPAEDFARRYQSARQQLESGYDRLDPEALTSLAARQGADHLIALAPRSDRIPADVGNPAPGPLRLLHRAGRFAVYQVRPETLADRPDSQLAANRREARGR